MARNAPCAENRGPDDQRQEAQGGRESDRHADNPRLDNGLDDKIQYAVDRDHDNCSHDVLIEQGGHVGGTNPMMKPMLGM